MTSPTLQENETLGARLLSIALVGPDDQRRTSVAMALAASHTGTTREFSAYPALDDIPQLLQQDFDVVIVDLDGDPEYALELIENICATSATTVMIYSAQASADMADLLVRCMRAGAREFITLPITSGSMAEALVRTSVRRPVPQQKKKVGGKLLVFLGAKGGAGVTTLASNYAVSLAKESGLNTLLIDLDLPLGDAALNLGIASEYSTFNALQNESRLDTNFLAKLLVKHSSGLSVLGAPGKFAQIPTTGEAIDKLLTVARQSFDYVVVDAGTRLDLTDTALFAKASTIYLVAQVSIPELRNANRLITECFTSEGPKLEIVLNRYTPRSLGVDEEHVTKALTRPPTWRVPNDYATVRRTQNTATPLSLEDSPIARVIRQMARTISGLPPEPEKKKGFSLFSKK